MDEMKATYQVGTDDTGYFKYITNPEGRKLIEGIPRDLTNFAYELRAALTAEVTGYKDALKLANENIGTLQEQVGNLHRNYAAEFDAIRAERDSLTAALEHIAEGAWNDMEQLRERARAALKVSP